ncbi:hypothetical protein Ciccas_012899, partial [Cichlidogyrus casuarinus]
MDSASRQAQRLADNFVNDLDNMARNSRLADRRAMSHFESRIQQRADSLRRRRRGGSQAGLRGQTGPPCTQIVFTGGRFYDNLQPPLPTSHLKSSPRPTWNSSK